MSPEKLSSEQKLELLLNRNSDLPPNRRPGWTLSVRCCGAEVGSVLPREWTGTFDLGLEEIRRVVTGTWITGLRQQDADSEVGKLTRAERKRLMRSTEFGRQLTDADPKPTAAVDRPDVAEVSWWRGRFRCSSCGEEVPCRLDKLMAVATKLADADVPQIALRDLRWSLSQV